jgi:hypothetical protein
LPLTVNRILLFEEESDENLWGLALTSLTSLIRASTTSMTAVPKPLKFMIPHYDKMKQIYEKMLHSPVKGRKSFKHYFLLFFSVLILSLPVSCQLLTETCLESKLETCRSNKVRYLRTPVSSLPSKSTLLSHPSLNNFAIHHFQFCHQFMLSSHDLFQLAQRFCPVYQLAICMRLPAVSTSFGP